MSAIKNNIIALVILFLSYSCAEEIKQDAPGVRKDSIRKTIKSSAPVPELPTDFSGTYKLITTRNRDWYIEHIMELEQSGDSVQAIYSASYYVQGQEPFARVKGTSVAEITKMDNMKRAMLYIKITESHIDSLKYADQSWARYISIPNQEYGAAFPLRFSEKKKTIEHNYAGGEWDTWEKIK